MIPTIAQKQIDHISEQCKGIKPLVAIRCITYNQGLYLRDALEGFVMQKTDFPFVAIVHDDFSTDNTAEIIREYAEKYPNVIFPIYEEENLYSKKNGSLSEVMNAACDATDAKYIALCEGDDYWTDPLKIQKQITFLESNPEFSFSFHNYQSLDQETKTFSKILKYPKKITTKKILEGGGGYIATASIIYRQNIIKDLCKIRLNHPVGDLPLQIFLALKGKAHFINEPMSIYRINIKGSWTTTITKKRSIQDKNCLNLQTIALLQRFDAYSEYKYHKSFIKRINFNLSCYFANNKDIKNQIKYTAFNTKSFFKLYIKYLLNFFIK